VILRLANFNAEVGGDGARGDPGRPMADADTWMLASQFCEAGLPIAREMMDEFGARTMAIRHRAAADASPALVLIYRDGFEASLRSMLGSAERELAWARSVDFSPRTVAGVRVEIHACAHRVSTASAEVQIRAGDRLATENGLLVRFLDLWHVAHLRDRIAWLGGNAGTGRGFKIAYGKHGARISVDREQVRGAAA